MSFDEQGEDGSPVFTACYKFSILAYSLWPAAKLALLPIFDMQKIPKLYEEKERQSRARAVGDFELMNPNTLTAPLFRARADLDLTRKLYRTAPVLIRERARASNRWR